MIYLYGYLAIGVVYGLSVWIVHALRSRKDELSEAVIAALGKAKAGQSFSFLEDIFVPFWAIVLIVTAWPLVVVMSICDKRRFKRNRHDDGEEQFAVAAEDLLERLTIQEIEQREMVIDPLHSVPELPFGHLHPVWVKFKDALGEQDAVYSFTKIWHPPLSFYHQEVSGYACVRGEQPEQYMLAKVVEVAPDPPSYERVR